MTQTNSKRKRILVVEDEPVICRVCMKVLTAEGFEVDIASDGLVAKDMVNKKEYGLCIIDIRTPGMNGMELYEHLKGEHQELASRMIFTTGDVLSGNIGEFLMKVNRPYLTKPFTPDELRAKVTEALK